MLSKRFWSEKTRMVGLGWQRAESHQLTIFIISSQDFNGPVALVMGNEANGLSRFWENHADLQVTIPSLGKADSLNLSTPIAVCL